MEDKPPSRCMGTEGHLTVSPCRGIREGERQSLRPLIHSLNACDSQSWTRHSSQVSHMGSYRRLLHLRCYRAFRDPALLSQLQA